MIFVDTSAWYACVVSSDPNNPAAVKWLANNQEAVVTTDYIIDETLTLLRARGHPVRAVALGEEFFQKNQVILHFLSRDEVEAAWEVFRKFNDKEWSFTDCTSKVVIENRQIITAFAFDHHYRQFGTVTVVP